MGRLGWLARLGTADGCGVYNGISDSRLFQAAARRPVNTKQQNIENLDST